MKRYYIQGKLFSKTTALAKTQHYFDPENILVLLSEDVELEKMWDKVCGVFRDVTYWWCEEVVEDVKSDVVIELPRWAVDDIKKQIEKEEVVTDKQLRVS